MLSGVTGNFVVLSKNEAFKKASVPSKHACGVHDDHTITIAPTTIKDVKERYFLIDFRIIKNTKIRRMTKTIKGQDVKPHLELRQVLKYAVYAVPYH